MIFCLESLYPLTFHGVMGQDLLSLEKKRYKYTHKPRGGAGQCSTHEHCEQIELIPWWLNQSLRLDSQNRHPPSPQPLIWSGEQHIFGLSSELSGDGPFRYLEMSKSIPSTSHGVLRPISAACIKKYRGRASILGCCTVSWDVMWSAVYFPAARKAKTGQFGG